MNLLIIGTNSSIPQLLANVLKGSICNAHRYLKLPPRKLCLYALVTKMRLFCAENANQ